MNRYRVWHVTGASEDAREAHFAVRGPRVNEFAVAAELAKAMQAALNGPAMTPRRWRVIRQALSAALAGEWSAGDLNWSQSDAGVAQGILDQL